MTDYTKRCEGPATYGVLVISICIQLPVLYTYGGDVNIKMSYATNPDVV